MTDNMTDKITSVISHSETVHNIDDTTLLLGEIKKEWIMSPPSLGSKKLYILDQFKTSCICGKHTTKIYILQQNYCTMHCHTKGWAWISKPKNLDEIKELSKTLN